MEFADVGQHCRMAHCSQQDFLPFKCEFCKEIYCADHRRPLDHQCQSGKGNDIDDNFVIICPLCQTVLKLKGIAKQGITPAHVWNEHVEIGECQMKQNQRWQSKDQIANGRSTHCQAKSCKTKLNDINTFKCLKCQMDLCLQHRYDDLHDCVPVKKTQKYEKLKKSIGFFNYNKEEKSIKKTSSQTESFGTKFLRFFVCCGNTKEKNQNGKKDPQKQVKLDQVAQSEQKFKCPLCGRVCQDQDLLLVHMEEYHREKKNDKEMENKKERPSINSQEIKKEISKKCPHCYKRFKDDELEFHIKNEHFMAQ